jgi:membrane protein
MAGLVERAKRRSLQASIDMVVVGGLAIVAYQLGRLERPVASQTRGRKPDHSGANAASAERGRGRAAGTPSQFTGRAWKDILVRTYNETLEDRIATVSGGIAFYGLLAVFPGIAALVSLYGLVADPATIRDHLATLSFLLPPTAFSVVEDQINRVISQGGTELGIKFALGLGFSLWSANAGMKALLDGLNIAYEEEEKRSFIRLNLVSLGLTAAVLFALLAVIGLTTILPAIFDTGPHASVAKIGISILRWPVMLLLLALGLSILYRYGPSRDKPRWRWVTWGGAVAAVMIILISLLLSWYLSHLADYNKTYGSLGAVIALMTWMWLSACAVLVGAELNAEMEHQTARDTTIGAPKPLGARGAEMADTIGASTD